MPVDPRWEPGAGNPLAGFCPGGRPKGRSLPERRAGVEPRARMAPAQLRPPGRPLALRLTGLLARSWCAILALMNDDATPLSDLITRCVQEDTPENYERFLTAFTRASVGVVANGVPPGTVGLYRAHRDELSLATGELPDGLPAVLVSADPAVFRRRYGGPFNAEMDGLSVMRTVLANPECQAIRVNSAASEHSMAIPRATLQRIIDGPTREAPIIRKPWWKLW